MIVESRGSCLCPGRVFESLGHGRTGSPGTESAEIEEIGCRSPRCERRRKQRGRCCARTAMSQEHTRTGEGRSRPAKLVRMITPGLTWVSPQDESRRSEEHT